MQRAVRPRGTRAEPPPRPRSPRPRRRPARGRPSRNSSALAAWRKPAVPTAAISSAPLAPRLLGQLGDRVDRPPDRLLAEPPGLVDPLAEPGHLGAVDHRPPLAVVEPLADVELDRVRADVDCRVAARHAAGCACFAKYLSALRVFVCCSPERSTPACAGTRAPRPRPGTPRSWRSGWRARARATRPGRATSRRRPGARAPPA